MQRKYIELPSLTVDRGIAALIVAIYHATPIWGLSISKITNIGWTGVSFFFVLSGFVLTWSFDYQKNYKIFIVNRLSRIYPLHIFGLTTCIILYILAGSPYAGYIGTKEGTFLSVFLVHGWVPQHPEIRQAWDGVSWTLSLELAFYIVAPFLIRKSEKITTESLINIGTVIFAAYLLFAATAVSHEKIELADFLEFSPIARLPEFIYGIIACRLIQRGVDLKLNALHHIVIFLPFLIYTFAFNGNSPSLGIALTAPAFALIIMGCATKNITAHNNSEAKKLGLFHTLGEISFSLYMTHAIAQIGLAVIISKLPFHANNLIWMFVNLITAIVVAFATHKLIELPGRTLILTLFRRSLTKRKPENTIKTS